MHPSDIISNPDIEQNQILNIVDLTQNHRWLAQDALGAQIF